MLKAGFDVKLITLPNGEDPDSYIIKFGTEEFNKQIENAQEFLEFQTEQFYNAGVFEDSKKSAEAIRELVKYVALIDDELKRNILIKSISKKFNLREKLIEKELDNIFDINAKQEYQSERRLERKTVTTAASLQSATIPKATFNFEKELIELLLEGSEEIVEIIFDHIHPDDFQNDQFRTIATGVENGYNKNDISPESIIDSLDDELIKTWARSLTLSGESISKRWDDYHDEGNVELNHLQKAKDVVRKYRITLIDSQIVHNNHEIAVIEDDSVVMELMIQNKELAEQRKMIFEGQGNSDLI